VADPRSIRVVTLWTRSSTSCGPGARGGHCLRDASLGPASALIAPDGTVRRGYCQFGCLTIVKPIQISALPYFISGGYETNELRDIAMETVSVMCQALARCGTELIPHTWDFRKETGQVVPKGQVASRSLEEISKVDWILGILGDEIPLPQITQNELRRAAQMRRDNPGVVLDLFIRQPVGDTHKQFLSELENLADGEIIYEAFEDNRSFQLRVSAVVMRELINVRDEMRRT
jgi:hypothetical protein